MNAVVAASLIFLFIVLLGSSGSIPKHENNFKPNHSDYVVIDGHCVLIMHGDTGIIGAVRVSPDSCENEE